MSKNELLLNNVLNEIYLMQKGVRDCVLVDDVPCSDPNELVNTIFTIEQMAIKSGFRIMVNHVEDENSH